MNGRIPLFDVAVCGGGPAGSAAALSLARAGRSVVLLDAIVARPHRPAESLPPAARPLLRELDLLSDFLHEPHATCHGNVSAWNSAELSSRDFLLDGNGPGWQLDRGRFDAFLLRATRHAGVQVKSGARLAGEHRSRGQWQFVAAGEPMRSRWIVDATGRSSSVARRRGAKRVKHDRLTAFFTRLRSAIAGDRDGRTHIESVPDGWWYSALHPSGGRAVAYFTDIDLADRTQWISANGFLAALQRTRHLSALLSGYGYSLLGRPRGVDASTARLDRFAGPGWLAAGDAAISFDPLSSQGVFNALYLGIMAGRALDACLSGHADAVDRYVSGVEEIFCAYQANCAAYYGAERRWTGRPFWQRRSKGSMQE